MLKKMILLSFLSFSIITKIYAQSFMHGIGANISVLTAKINTPSDQYTFTMAVTHFSYFPRFTLTESENSSVSIGSPLGAGVGFLSSGGETGGIAWGFELPLAVDYNIGCKSTPDNENTFGGYFGAGFSYLYTGWTDGNETSKANTYGPLARTGVRFASSQSDWSVTIGLFFKYGLEKEKYKTFGFNIIADF